LGITRCERGRREIRYDTKFTTITQIKSKPNNGDMTLSPSGLIIDIVNIGEEKRKCDDEMKKE